MIENLKLLHKIPLEQKLKVAAYARISRDKLDLENSLENQIRYYTTLINQNSAWEFAGIYADDGISGSSIKKRDQFRIMINKALANEIDVILVKSISRFARNTIDLLTTIQDLRDEGIEVYFEKEKLSSLDTKSDTFITMYAQFAQEELVSISNNVKWTNQRKMETGQFYIDAARLFGYRFDDNRKIVINEKEAIYVRKIFEMYADGNNTASIADFLEYNSVPTITGNGRWSSSTLRRMLKNEKYCGDVLLQKSYSENPISQKRIINKGQKEQYLIKDAIPPIVTRDLWMKCQQVMNDNAEKYKLGHKNCLNKVTPFTSFGFCPYCRNTYFRKFNRKVEMLYCSSNKHRHQCSESESVYISDLKKMIPILVQKLKDNRTEFKNDLIEEFSKNPMENTDISKASENEDVQNINKQINELKAQLNKYSVYEDEAFISLTNELRKTISDLESKKLIYENNKVTSISPETRAKIIIETLDGIPKTDDIGDFNFRKLFKNLIVLNRDRLIFVVGSEDLSNLPLNPNKIPMQYICEYKYKIRSSTSICYFGIFINK